QIIPNSLIVFGLVAGMFFSALNVTVSISDSILGMLVGAGCLLAVALIGMLMAGKEAMGGGDIKLLGSIGVFLGWKLIIMTLLLSIYIGGIVSIILLLFKIKHRGEYIPFGPFIGIAAIISLLWGDTIISWYIISFSRW